MNDNTQLSDGDGTGQVRAMLIFCVGSRLCALPVETVIETMRPLPVALIAGAPAFVQGVSVIRGEPLPVVDAAALLEETEARSDRLITLTVNGRNVALAVDSVLGVHEMSDESLHALSPLLDEAGGELISAIGTLDAELLVVLERARLVPEEVWGLMEADSMTS